MNNGPIHFGPFRCAVRCSLLFLLGSIVATAQTPNDLVTIEKGEIPIILSAPHGGQKAIPGVMVRKGVGVERFRNRSDAYHQGLVDARSEIIERWGHGILLDIHGQASEPKAIFRGTRNGQTTNHLVQRFGREALVGESSLFGQIAKQGLRVIPAVGTDDAENPAYDGGHIVATYGSRQYGTIDAIQLELGWDLRSPDLSTKTAQKLASAIKAFGVNYLRMEEHDVVPSTE